MVDKIAVINRLLPKAKELNENFGLHVSMTIAQVVRESGWLEHAPGNNFLGIKVPKDSSGSPVSTFPKDKMQLLWTTEWSNGKWIKIQDWFVK